MAERFRLWGRDPVSTSSHDSWPNWIYRLDRRCFILIRFRWKRIIISMPTSMKAPGLWAFKVQRWFIGVSQEKIHAVRLQSHCYFTTCCLTNGRDSIWTNRAFSFSRWQKWLSCVPTPNLLLHTIADQTRNAPSTSRMAKWLRHWTQVSMSTCPCGFKPHSW